MQARKEVENEARFNAMLSVEATARKRKRSAGFEVPPPPPPPHPSLLYPPTWMGSSFRTALKSPHTLHQHNKCKESSC